MLVETLKTDHKMLTLTHDAIPEWDWPEMTMDFIATDSVDFSQLKEGLNLHVEVTRSSSGDYMVSNIHIPEENNMSDMESAQDNEEASDTSSATATGTINSLMIDHGMINISRSAIEKWGRPAATVDFITGHDVSLEGLTVGMEVEFTFEIRGEHFVIFKIAPLGHSEQTGSSPKAEKPTVDHSNH